VTSKKQQAGVVLVGGLFFLMIMTLAGVALVKNIAMEEKIASNYRQKVRSLEAAEVALKTAARYLQKKPDVMKFYKQGKGGPPGMYVENPQASIHPWQTSEAWSADNSIAVDDDQYLPSSVRLRKKDLGYLHLKKSPRFMIGLAGERNLDGMDSGISQKFFVFNVTSRAQSGVETIGTTLQARVIQSL